MMTRVIKCFHCKEVVGNDYVKDTNFKTVRYIHKECKGEYMKKQTAKCKWCGEKTVYKYKSLDGDGKSSKKEEGYFHENCYPLFLEDKEFKQKERKELDELNDYLLNLFNVKFLNHGVYTILASVRNGDSGALGGKAIKNKEGYPYSTILETFKYCEESIYYALRTKDFEGLNHALKYILYIVTDKLGTVQGIIDRREENKRELELSIKHRINNLEDYEVEEEEKKKPVKDKSRPNFFD